MRLLQFQITVVVAVLLLLPAVGASGQQPRDLQRERIQTLLAAPVHEAARPNWLSVGEKTTTIAMLIDLVEKRSARRIYRIRALNALRFFPRSKVRQFLWGIVHHRELEGAYRRSALISIGYAFQRAVMQELSMYLRKKDRFLREGAIIGLGWIRDHRARTILENHFGVEEEIVLREAIEKAIAQVRAWEDSIETEERLRTLEKEIHENSKTGG